MNTMRSILTATDLSAPSRHAATRAAMLAHRTGASLTLMHTLGGSALDDLRRWLGAADGASNVVEADARERLQALSAELAQRHAIEVRTQLAVGHPVEEITRHANQVDADVLVTGTRGAGFFRGVVIGSTAERIAKRSTRPVLMVRQLPHEPYRRVLVPVDFSPWSLEAIRLAQMIAPEATLVLMHAIEVPYEGKLRLAGVADSVILRYRDQARLEAQQRLDQLVAAAGLATGQVEMLTPTGADPWMLIVQEEQEQDCDLVVIGRQGRHAADEFLLGSTTRMVISEGSADMLVSTRGAVPG